MWENIPVYISLTFGLTKVATVLSFRQLETQNLNRQEKGNANFYRFGDFYEYPGCYYLKQYLHVRLKVLSTKNNVDRNHI